MKINFQLLMVISFLFSLEFETKLGKCNLIFDEQFNSNSKEYILFIQNDLNNLVNEFGEVDKYPFEIFITNKINKFKKLTKGPTPEWGVGIAKINPPRIIIKGTQLGKISYNRLNEILRHELNHIYLFRTPNYHILPKWFVEGFASYWADELTITKKIQISSALWENRQFALEGLKSFNLFNRIHANLAYAQSAVAIHVLIYFYGKNKLIEIIQKNSDNNDFDNHFKKITYDTSLDFTYKYEKYLNKNFKWMFLLKSSNILFISLPLILIIGYFIKIRNNRLILKKWEEEEKLQYEDDEESY
tara:strand:- start:3071 stop:3976 length:906 start_codon:yes stop_codon:yes gene_type:complete